MLVALPLLKMLGLSDPLASFAGEFSQALFYYFFGFALAPWMLWMATAMGFIRITPSAVSR